MEYKAIMILSFLSAVVLFCITSIFLETSASERVPEPEVYFCPRENCSNLLINLIEDAKSSVHCALFDLDIVQLQQALFMKSKKIDVKLVIDNENYISLPNAVYDDSSQFTHNKFCVIDRKAVWTGSFNPTFRGANRNNNNAILVYSHKLADNYESEFMELWEMDFGAGSQTRKTKIRINNITIENYFCPEDQCSGKIIKELQKAKQSIHFMTFVFTNEAIADTVLAKDVEIKGVFEKSQAGSRYSQFERMKSFGLNIRKDNNSYNMHHKVFIIDNRTVITGSFNPTQSADTKNDENILIIHDKGIADEYMEEFLFIWGQSLA